MNSYAYEHGYHKDLQARLFATASVQDLRNGGGGGGDIANSDDLSPSRGPMAANVPSPRHVLPPSLGEDASTARASITPGSPVPHANLTHEAGIVLSPSPANSGTGRIGTGRAPSLASRPPKRRAGHTPNEAGVSPLPPPRIRIDVEMAMEHAPSFMSRADLTPELGGRSPPPPPFRIGADIGGVPLSLSLNANLSPNGAPNNQRGLLHRQITDCENSPLPPARALLATPPLAASHADYSDTDTEQSLSQSDVTAVSSSPILSASGTRHGILARPSAHTREQQAPFSRTGPHADSDAETYLSQSDAAAASSSPNLSASAGSLHGILARPSAHTREQQAPFARPASATLGTTPADRPSPSPSPEVLYTGLSFALFTPSGARYSVAVTGDHGGNVDAPTPSSGVWGYVPTRFS